MICMDEIIHAAHTIDSALNNNTNTNTRIQIRARHKRGEREGESSELHIFLNRTEAEEISTTQLTFAAELATRTTLLLFQFFSNREPLPIYFFFFLYISTCSFYSLCMERLKFAIR